MGKSGRTSLVNSLQLWPGLFMGEDQLAEITSDIFKALKHHPRGGLKFVVVTPSMEPVVMVGDHVTVDMTSPINRWDIVVWWDGEKLICHVLWHINRLVTLDGEVVYITCALKGSRLDLSVPASQLLGKVTNFKLSWLWRVRVWWNHRRQTR